MADGLGPWDYINRGMDYKGRQAGVGGGARQGKHLRDAVEVGDLATLPGNHDGLFDADRYSTATRPEQPYPPAYYPASERRVRWVGRLAVGSIAGVRRRIVDFDKSRTMDMGVTWALPLDTPIPPPP